MAIQFNSVSFSPTRYQKTPKSNIAFGTKIVLDGSIQKRIDDIDGKKESEKINAFIKEKKGDGNDHTLFIKDAKSTFGATQGFIDGNPDLKITEFWTKTAFGEIGSAFSQIKNIYEQMPEA